MKKFVLASTAMVLSTPAFAGIGSTLPPSTPVPEISALEGTAALAALAAVVLIAWERRRRAA
ncbi:MAG: VPEID-CTERM sorting domain-containing protein [Pseudomonadota bacterium]